MQTIVTSLIFGDDEKPAPVTEISPWLEARRSPIEEILGRLEAQTHRRVIKSHSPADCIPWYSDARYVFVCRDGRDAVMSALNHMRKMRFEVLDELFTSALAEGIELPEEPPSIDDVHDFFPEWLERSGFFHIVESYWSRRDRPNLLLVHYNDLKADLDAEMRRVAEFLGIGVEEDLWPELVRSATFESMKADADRIGTFELFEGGAETFLHKGTNGRWRDVLHDDELDAYDAEAARWLDEAARSWMTSGRASGALGG